MTVKKAIHGTLPEPQGNQEVITGTHQEPTLEELAEAIRECEADVLGGLRTCLHRARDSGNFLNLAKPKVKEAGLKWLVWIKENCGFGRATANNRMRIADAWADVCDANSIKEAVDWLDEEAKTPKKKSKSSRKKPMKAKVDGVIYLVEPRPGFSPAMVLESLRVIAVVTEEDEEEEE